MKYDFKRRRAVKCEFVEKSKTSPGYLKYEVTICEKDGTIHKQPVYGRDMQSALNRLINKELTYKFEKKLETNTGLIFIAWLAIMVIPVIFFETQNTPWMLLYTFGTIIVLMAIATLWYNYIKKGE